MLELKISAKEFFDPNSNLFINIPSCTLTLEHSLISVSKWESKWQIPYLDGKPKTDKQEIDYIRCMVVGPIKDNRVIDTIGPEELLEVSQYIQSGMTATTFATHKEISQKNKKEIMTSEVIYSHLFANGISIECQKWHLNRLLTLIRVCNLQNAPKEKMTKKQAAAWSAEQNAARRAKYKTRG